MSAATMSSSSGLPRSHASDENRGRGRVAGKVRNRATQVHPRSINADENPVHPGKAVNPASVPLSTPRKALSQIDPNSKTLNVTLATPSQKGSKKLDQKRMPQSSAGKPKQQLREKKRVRSNTGCAVKEQSCEVDSEMFPDIEIMSTKREEDEFDSNRRFVPPAYFDSLVAALKQPPLPPIGEFPCTGALSSFKLERETTLRPNRSNAEPPIPVLYPLCDPLYEEDLVLPVDLPDLDHL